MNARRRHDDIDGHIAILEGIVEVVIIAINVVVEDGGIPR
jgi:hypothetical protein